MFNKVNKNMGSVILMLMLSIFIILGCVRYITFQTVLNESFQLKHQQETKYYNFIYKNLMQELADITLAYELPDRIIDSIIRPIELQALIQKQTIELLKLNRGERDTFPDVNLIYLAEDYVARAAMYVGSEPDHVLNDANMQQTLFEEVDRAINEHLKVVDYDEYYNSDCMKRIHRIYNVIVSRGFHVFVWIGILSLVATLGWIWRKQIQYFLYFGCLSLIVSGITLFVIFMTHNKFLYLLPGVSTNVGKQLLFDITMTDMLKQLSNYGVTFFMVGIVSIVSLIIFNQLRALVMPIPNEAKSWR